MPAPVPPGYTRGPIALLARAFAPTIDEGIYQWVWREAGGFGARLVLITVEAAHVQSVAMLAATFAALECDQVVEVVVLDRAAARDRAHAAAVEQSTATLVVGDDPLLLAATLGGTPLAQAIRRANARSKMVVGIGAASAFLCQHIISPGQQPNHLRGMVTFGPGLGLVNRLVVDIDGVPNASPITNKDRLAAAVATNPFLIGVGLVAGSGAILYPDNTLQSSGPNTILLMDGQSVEAANFDAASGDAVVGALQYTLHTGDGFNLDDHSLRPAGEVDLPPTGPVTSVF